MASFASIARRLEAVGQGHLLRFYDTLSPERQHALLDQIESLQVESLPRLIDLYVKNAPHFRLPADVRPAPYYPREPESGARSWDLATARARGEALLRAGKVAAFTVAGGQGSRLGFDGPKGCFPGGAVTEKPLFQIFAEGILAAGRRYGRTPPWYIMTSPLNHEATVTFFRDRSHFGLAGADVVFFRQGVLPSFEIASGRVLLSAPGEVATNPDGHGGSVRALHVSGALEDMRRRGVEHISYFQVDNPTVRVIDPVFLGLHAGAPDSSGEMSSKMVPKAYAEEKLGMFCASGDRTMVIEYSDLPMDRQRERLPDGTLRFLAGSIAVHAMSVEFVSRLNTDAGFELPFHRAEKKVPFVDPADGRTVQPAANNAVKLERFVFDALPLCRASVVLETDRLEEFAPIKNATGADSVESSRALQTARAAQWLEAAGVRVPRRPDGVPDCVLEISPLTAVEAGDLAARALPRSIQPGTRVAL